MTTAVLSAEVASRSSSRPPRNTRDFGVEGLALLAASALSSFAVIWIFFYQLTLLSGVFGFALCWFACFLRHLLDRDDADGRPLRRNRPDRDDDHGVVRRPSSSACFCTSSSMSSIKGVGHFSFGFLTNTLAYYQPADPIGRRRRTGDRGHVRASGPRHTDGGATGLLDRHLPERGRRLGHPVRPHHRHRHEWRALGRRGCVHLRRLHRARTSSATPASPPPSRCSSYASVGHPDDGRGPPGRARRSARSLAWLWVPRNGGRFAKSSCPRPARASSPPWCSGSPSPAVETAPLIFTAFGNSDMNPDPSTAPRGRCRSCSTRYIFQAQKAVVELAFTAAFVLLAIVLILFVVARLFGRRSTRKGRIRRAFAAPVRWVRSI